MTLPQIGGMFNGDRARKITLVEYGFRLPSALDNRPLQFDEFMALVPQMINVSATPGDFELRLSQGVVVEQIIRPTGLVDPEVDIRPVRGQVDDLLNEIRMREARHERVLVTTLTKRMSEDLTDYLQQAGVRVRYLHSDIDAIERMEILRGLRLGDFDVLVGINLLREGLDLPEVSLVAILDADQEGFLRSDRSLVQTIGRAARHVNGRAIMYADRITGSMQRALDEMTRRRDDPAGATTPEHGITPRSIIKSMEEVRLSTHVADARTERPEPRRAMQERVDLRDPARRAALIQSLERQMREAAANLEFELAAMLRDQLNELKAMARARRAARRRRPGSAATRDPRAHARPSSRPRARRWAASLPPRRAARLRGRARRRQDHVHPGHRPRARRRRPRPPARPTRWCIATRGGAGRSSISTATGCGRPTRRPTSTGKGSRRGRCHPGRMAGAGRRLAARARAALPAASSGRPGAPRARGALMRLAHRDRHRPRVGGPRYARRADAVERELDGSPAACGRAAADDRRGCCARPASGSTTSADRAERRARQLHRPPRRRRRGQGAGAGARAAALDRAVAAGAGRAAWRGRARRCWRWPTRCAASCTPRPTGSTRRRADAARAGGPPAGGARRAAGSGRTSSSGRRPSRARQLLERWAGRAVIGPPEGAPHARALLELVDGPAARVRVDSVRAGSRCTAGPPRRRHAGRRRMDAPYRIRSAVPADAAGARRDRAAVRSAIRGARRASARRSTSPWTFGLVAEAARGRRGIPHRPRGGGDRRGARTWRWRPSFAGAASAARCSRRASSALRRRRVEEVFLEVRESNRSAQALYLGLRLPAGGPAGGVLPESEGGRAGAAAGDGAAGVTPAIRAAGVTLVDGTTCAVYILCGSTPVAPR